MSTIASIPDIPATTTPSPGLVAEAARGLTLLGYRPADAFRLGLDSGAARALALSMATLEAVRSCLP
jgi:hypothetical protein